MLILFFNGDNLAFRLDPQLLIWLSNVLDDGCTPINGAIHRASYNHIIDCMLISGKLLMLNKALSTQVKA
jgi:hypothetical protein